MAVMIYPPPAAGEQQERLRTADRACFTVPAPPELEGYEIPAWIHGPVLAPPAQVPVPEQVEVIPARYLQMRCWNVRDGRGGRSE
ncbi:hypothetical protein APZ13_31095 [Escherichia coli]|nr:hypothetical protein APZ13_31095 [Escherichia coli]